MNNYSDVDLIRIRSLRKYYRNNFKNGDSDDCFLTWIEDGLKILDYRGPSLPTPDGDGQQEK